MELTLVVVTAALANSISQISLKIASHQLRDTSLSLVKRIFSVLIDGFFLLGVVAFGVSLALYVWLLRSYDVTIVYPAMGVTQVFVLVLSSLWLKEYVTSRRMIGTGLTIIGLAMLLAG
jgi:uncharacterized membrane protein